MEVRLAQQASIDGYALMAEVWYNHLVGKSMNMTVV